MRLAARHQGSLADFDYLLVGRGTLLVRSDKATFVPGSLRALLSRLDTEESRLGFHIHQSAWYLPNLMSFGDPIDIGSAAVSYVRRHPDHKAIYSIAPQRGLVTLVIDTAVRSLPGVDARVLHDPLIATPLLRLREPDLPTSWHDLLLQRHEAA